VTPEFAEKLPPLFVPPGLPQNKEKPGPGKKKPHVVTPAARLTVVVAVPSPQLMTSVLASMALGLVKLPPRLAKLPSLMEEAWKANARFDTSTSLTVSVTGGEMSLSPRASVTSTCTLKVAGPSLMPRASSWLQVSVGRTPLAALAWPLIIQE
jgi:hypothetical protein